ncbi:hypothetical protein LTR62_000777 [Meristemomyces frigidus]|uniref:DUF6594 domain-containing protein n=1 Tax=Meristemomyces frigidus TaxID=1508187 RepID=A0AAN7TM86_9PEZI|nr:hypothetical protein LTR62_000777 [Meristemomyces frigidus]
MPRAKSPNVFDYMVAASNTSDDRDALSTTSSASSSSLHYEPSLASSVEAPDTPSSQSTFPSPTATRSHSVAELRRKHDPDYAYSEISVRSDGHPTDSPSHSMKLSSVTDVPEDDEGQCMHPTAPSELEYQPRERSVSRSSRSSKSSRRSTSQTEEARRQYMAHAVQGRHPGYYVDPVYGQHRSLSASSAHSVPYGYHVAMQQYQWPSPPAAPLHPASMNGHLDRTTPPPAPDAPDLTQKTYTGYEQLAQELSAVDSSVTPLYRKFDYLNHRILLHLQDELAELEEHLRTLDEILAQMEPASPEGKRLPASRRAETYSGSEIHHQRTHLLGRIFIKTEQYNRAMSSYTSMAKNSVSAESEQVESYRLWMKNHTPIHESESCFLHHPEDLVAPGTPSLSSSPKLTTTHATTASLPFLPLALMLPFLLFSLIPSLTGRLAVTALIGAGIFIVAGTTRIREVLSLRNCAVCAAVYFLVMGAVAGCVPLYGG